MKAHARDPRFIRAQTKNHRKKQCLKSGFLKVISELGQNLQISSGRSMLNHGALTASRLSPLHHQTGSWHHR